MDNKIKDNKIKLELSKKDFELIFKWYLKGFTDIDEDKPLIDRLKQIYEGETNGRITS